MMELSRQDMHDLLHGTEVAGCGASWAIRPELPSFVDKMYDTDRKVVLLEPSKIGDDDVIWSASTIGGEFNKELKEATKHLPRIKDLWEEVAAMELSAFLGVEPDAYMVGHAGGTNGVLSLVVAGLTGKPAIDGDTTGRSKPEGGSTLNLLGIRPPRDLGRCVVTPFGDIAIFKKNVNPYVVRWMSIPCDGLVGSVSNRGPWKVFKDAIIPNTISINMHIGAAVRKARERGDDPVEAFIEAGDGFKLFQGRIKSWEAEHRESFLWGTHILEGTGDYKGHTFKNWFKNENLMTWKDGKVHASVPDLVCIVNAQTSDGIFNWDPPEKHIGEEVVVVGLKNTEVWRTPKGLELFGPKRWGFTEPYTPVEELE